MLVDVTLVNSYHKPFADSTLNNMKKSELIEYVRMLEYNYNVAVSFNRQQAENVKQLLDQKWIPVSERLPDVGIDVLVIKDNSDRNMAVWRLYRTIPNAQLYWEDEVGDGLVLKAASHWMPLPEPPKGE